MPEPFPLGRKNEDVCWSVEAARHTRHERAQVKQGRVGKRAERAPSRSPGGTVPKRSIFWL